MYLASISHRAYFRANTPRSTPQGALGPGKAGEDTVEMNSMRGKTSRSLNTSVNVHWGFWFEYLKTGRI